MKDKNVKVKRFFCSVFTASMLVSFCVQPGLSQDIEAINSMTKKKAETAEASSETTSSMQPGLEILSDDKKKAVEIETTDSNTLDIAEVTQAPPPEETTTDSKTPWLLYGGAAALGVGILAVAISSTSSDGDSSTTTDDSVPPVGPDIAGNDWLGTIDLANYGNEGVTAVVTQTGSAITITTSTTLPYGAYFSGQITSSGYISVRDAATNQTWTTHRGNASTSQIQLYDYVDNFTKFDTLFLIH